MNFKYENTTVPFAESEDTNLVIQLMGLAGLNPFVRHNSSPRQAMMNKHIAQMLVVAKPDIRRIQTGIDRNFGRYTHKVKFDSNSIVLKVIPKYPAYLASMQNVLTNPLTTVIYEDADSDKQVINVKQIPSYHSLHQHFGFNFNFNKRFSDYIRQNAAIPAGTIIADSPNIDEDGNYRFGVSAKVAFTSSASGIEDGVKVSREFLEKLKIDIFDNRTIQFGMKSLPLNLYGDDNRYKIIPDVGEKIGADGVLAVLREYESDLAPCDLSVEALQNPNTFDEYIYGYPNAEIVDIKIVHNNHKGSVMLTGMDEQLNKYLNAQTVYYESIVKEYNRLKQQSRGSLVISNELHNVVAEAMAMTDTQNGLTYTEKNNELDDWYLNITFKYQLTPDVGFKVTDLSGGKGVIVKVVPSEEMLTDADGNVAEIEMDADSVIKRMNLAKLYEQYVNAAGAATTKRIKEMIVNKSLDEYEKAWEYILGFYKIVSPKMYKLICDNRIDPINHLDDVMQNGIYLWMPTDNPVNHPDMIRLLQQYYPACYGPCTYIGQTGQKITTKNSILIGEVHFILLDKIANSFSAVSSAKLQHYGLPAKPNKRNKFADPIRTSPTRTAGESEVRLFVDVAGGEATADLLDRSSNPLVHKQIIKGMLESDKPTAVYQYVDRNKYPIGHSAIQNLTKHILQCAGVQFEQGDRTDDIKYNRY